jgi:hypothetical protein
MMRYLHVGIGGITPTVAQTEALQNTFNEAVDWMRYAPNCWILYTSQSPNTWTDKIRQTPGIPSTVLMVIVPIKAEEKWGLHQKWVWEWFDKKRQTT